MEQQNPVGVGIVGSGVIFDAYARGLGLSPIVDVVRVADVDIDRARSKASEWGIPDAGSTQQLLDDDRVSIVVNLTPPSAHLPVSLAAFEAGKHVYVEKPVTDSLSTATAAVEAARAAGRILAAAPDTHLGRAGRTARAAIDAGIVGTVFAGTSFVLSSKVETWHPNPAAFYAAGGGPALDHGPYHLAQLINLLGPVTGVTGGGVRPRSVVPVDSPDRVVDYVPVEVNTHVTAILDFNGIPITTMYSFDIWDAGVPYIELYGTAGTLRLPKPNTFDNPVLIKLHGDAQFRELDPVGPPTVPDPPTPFRALGVEDLVNHLSGAPLRTGAEFAVHILEVLEIVTDQRLADGYTRTQTRTSRPVAYQRTETVPQ